MTPTDSFTLNHWQRIEDERDRLAKQVEGLKLIIIQQRKIIEQQQRKARYRRDRTHTPMSYCDEGPPKNGLGS